MRRMDIHLVGDKIMHPTSEDGWMILDRFKESRLSSIVFRIKRLHCTRRQQWRCIGNGNVKIDGETQVLCTHSSLPCTLFTQCSWTPTLLRPCRKDSVTLHDIF